MSTLEAKLLGVLRRKRRVVAALLLPALLAWVATGSACVTMTHGAPATTDHAAHAHAIHAGQHPGHHDATPQPVQPETPCAHCPSGGAVGVAHGCAVTDGTGAKLTNAPLPDAAPALPALGRVPLTSTPAPPLIRFAAPLRGATAPRVPLNLLHCVLLI